jgi:glycosyltransferase involved in cell wall biosynthesis
MTGIAVHIITADFPPRPGGLERWTADLASSLSRSWPRVVVYVCGDTAVSHHHCNERYEVVDVGLLRTVWEAPLVGSTWTAERIALERMRLDYVCLLNAVKTRALSSRDVMISNFAVGVGWTAALVSRELALSHIAALAGTDITRGLRNPRERSVIADVLSDAAAVVARSAEQVRWLSQIGACASPEMIETSIPAPTAEWNPLTLEGGDRTLFADSGYSYKKGTSVLFQAFRRIATSDASVKLVLCGATEPGQEEYWRVERERLEYEFGPRVKLLGYVDSVTLENFLQASHVYCSATLGEGASAARARAMCIGIPIVSTRCGEMSALKPSDNIILTDVGNADAFEAAIREMIARLMAGPIPIDKRAVCAARDRFSAEVEWSAWAQLVSSVEAA